ncbi:uncharacterized protein BJ171DRAFT_524421, partial [Polychytrium aggregatum]|uniref:uncharacterized protein n=1 Tax=Polychytrium aggregatum TaxID=110093 RepID=UPI0022FF45F0
ASAPASPPVAQKDEQLMNDKIPFSVIRMIDAVSNHNHSSIATKEALKLVDLSKYNLVCVNVKVSPPICRVMPKPAPEPPKPKKSTEPKSKEIQLSVSIGPHDLDIKLRKAREFLEKGYIVEFSVLPLMARNRVVGTGAAEMKLANEIVEALKPYLSRKPIKMGNNVSAIFKGVAPAQ